MKWSTILVLVFCACFALFAFADEKEKVTIPSEEPPFSLPEEDLEKLRGGAEKFQFQAEVNRMMTLIINSLYRNKEIFLRELISNASDALDKIRFLSLTNSGVLGSKTELSIRIQADKEKNILHIADSGLGMTKDDLVKNLGTIAKSGTADFLKKFEESSTDSNLIGQFGVGFYSVFLVADRVTVTTKHNDDKQYIWESSADSDFTIVEDPRGDTLGRGTIISLHLKPEASDYTNEETLRSLIKKYSEFINFPIYLWATKTEEIEVPSDAEGAEVPVEEEDEDDEVSDLEDEDEEGEDKPKTKMIEQTTTGFELINESKPIWLRSSSDVSENEYNKFFKSFFKETEDPMTHTHFRAEGEVEFRSLLFVPPKAPGNLYSSDSINEIKLFVRRVFITDTDAEPLLPGYLRFIKGVVDSDDLPLNVSRETLQQNKLLKVIKKKLTKKAIDMLKEFSEDKEAYEKFYKEYAPSIKLGIMEDAANRKRLSKLLRFYTSESTDKLISFDDYISRIKKGQDDIFYLAGSSMDELKASPFLERLQAKGYEVLLLTEAIDEYAFQSMTEFEGKRLINAAKEGLDLGDESSEDDSKFSPLLNWLKKVLSEHIDKASVSRRLTTSPSALVAGQYSWSGNMERIMQAQAYAKSDDGLSKFYLSQKKTMEINPKHPVIQELLKRVTSGDTGESTEDLAKLLFDTATLRSGFTLRNPVEFGQRIDRVMRANLGVDLDAEVEVNEEKVPLASEAEEDPEVEEEGDEEEETLHDEL